MAVLPPSTSKKHSAMMNKLQKNLPFNEVNNATTNGPSSIPRRGNSRLIISGAFLGSVAVIILFGILINCHLSTNEYLQHVNKGLLGSRNEILEMESKMETIKSSMRKLWGSNRLDYAQLTQGAKLIRFQGIELNPTMKTGDKIRQYLGYYVPREGCRILGKGLNKRKYLTVKGPRAIVTIKLHQPIYPDTIRVDHYIDDLQNPLDLGAMPKEIIVSGIPTRPSIQPIFIDRLHLNSTLHSKSQSVTIHVHTDEPFEVYRFEIKSNHGNPEMTKLFKIGIYGDVDHDQ